MTRILVTGASGNMGKQVVGQLLEKGVTIRIAMRNIEGIDDLKKQGVEAVSMDFDDKQSMEKALEGVDKAFSVNPLIPGMIEASKSFINQAKEAGVKHIVRASGLGADSPQAITLGRWHREVEIALENSGLDYTFVRPNSFFQNYINFSSHTIKTENAFYLPHGDGRISYIDTFDIAAVVVAALTESGHEGKAYNLTGPQAVSNHEIAEHLSQATGRTINYVDIPEETSRQGMLNVGIPEILANMLLELYALNKAGYTAEVSPVVEQVTGRKGITFEEFAKANAAAFI